MSERIEFYKNRSIGERLSVAIDFLKQNWKVLYKNILIGGFPLAIIMGYAMSQQIEMQTINDLSKMLIFYPVLLLAGLVNVVYMYSMTGAILHQYERNQLTESTGWNDLKNTFFQFAGKTFLITLIIYIALILIVAIFFMIFGVSMYKSVFSDASSGFLMGFFFIILLLGVTIALAPSFIMLYFPAYFSGKRIWESIKVSFSLGFKHWGSLFVAILLAIILIIIVYMVFSLPFQIASMFFMLKGSGANIFLYIFATLSAIGTLLSYPVMIVLFAFQYFSIVEQEEGVSLKSKMDEFENL